MQVNWRVSVSKVMPFVIVKIIGPRRIAHNFLVRTGIRAAVIVVMREVVGRQPSIDAARHEHVTHLIRWISRAVCRLVNQEERRVLRTRKDVGFSQLQERDVMRMVCGGLG